jgi:hypothetical protein
MDVIDKCFANMYGAIWKQALVDDVKIYPDIPLKELQLEILDEAERWQRIHR